MIGQANMRANAVKVAHDINVQIVRLRQLEVDYFSKFYSTFGIQAAILGSLAMSCMAQTPAFESLPFYAYTYWLGNSLSSIGGLFALILSLVIVVYGQALALRGPQGSMVRAVRGMEEEQKLIVSAMTFTFVFVGIMMCGIYLVMMEFPGAVVCSFISLMGVLYTLQACVRIYNRFWYLPVDDSWDDRVRYQSEDAFPIQPAVLEATGMHLTQSDTVTMSAQSQPKQQQRGAVDNSVSGTLGSWIIPKHTLKTPLAPNMNDKSDSAQADSMSEISAPRESMVSVNSVQPLQQDGNGIKYSPPPLAAKATPGNGPTTSSASINSFNLSGSAGTAATRALVAASVAGSGFALKGYGYLSMKEKKRFSKSWVRRYIVLRGTFMVYYNNKEEFESDPKSPICKRAIDLEGYNVVPTATETKFRLVVSPNVDQESLRSWEFRCDTLAELAEWETKFVSATTQ